MEKPSHHLLWNAKLYSWNLSKHIIAYGIVLLGEQIFVCLFLFIEMLFNFVVYKT